MQRFCVLGAGDGGMALAGHLGLLGFPVRLWSRNPFALTSVAQAGGVHLWGLVHGFGKVEAHFHLRAALAEADVILVAVPASAHRELAARMAPYLTPAQKVLLISGRTGGALAFTQALRQHCEGEIALVGEAQSSPLTGRRTGRKEAQILSVKRQVKVAALPASRTDELVDALRPAFPQFTAARWRPEHLSHCTLESDVSGATAVAAN